MLLVEFATRLLRHLHGLEALLINELKPRVDRLELGIGLKWDIFAGGQGDLQRVQLLAEVRGQKSLLSGDLDFYEMDRDCFHAVEVPFALSLKE